MKMKRSVVVCMTSICFAAGSFTVHAAKKGDDAQKQEFIKLDFKTLEETEKFLTEDESDLKDLPQAVKDLEGKVVRITGYFLIPREAYYGTKAIKSFAVSKSAFGCPCCTWGDPPTIFNTIMVETDEKSAVAPPFTPLIEVTGEFFVKKEQFTDTSGRKLLAPLFHIKNATAVKKKQSFLKSLLN